MKNAKEILDKAIENEMKHIDWSVTTCDTHIDYRFDESYEDDPEADSYDKSIVKYNNLLALVAKLKNEGLNVKVQYTKRLSYNKKVSHHVWVYAQTDLDGNSLPYDADRD